MACPTDETFGSYSVLYTLPMWHVSYNVDAVRVQFSVLWYT